VIGGHERLAGRRKEGQGDDPQNGHDAYAARPASDGRHGISRRTSDRAKAMAESGWPRRSRSWRSTRNTARGLGTDEMSRGRRARELADDRSPNHAAPRRLQTPRPRSA
jgi:hypothetical protein